MSIVIIIAAEAEAAISVAAAADGNVVLGRSSCVCASVFVLTSHLLP